MTNHEPSPVALTVDMPLEAGTPLDRHPACRTFALSVRHVFTVTHRGCLTHDINVRTFDPLTQMSDVVEFTDSPRPFADYRPPLTDVAHLSYLPESVSAVVAEMATAVAGITGRVSS